MKEKIEAIKKDFYLMYGRFNSSTGALIGMAPPETMEGLFNFLSDRFSDLIQQEREEAYKKGYIDGVLSYREHNQQSLDKGDGE